MLKTEKWLHFVETVGVFMHCLTAVLTTQCGFVGKHDRWRDVGQLSLPCSDIGSLGVSPTIALRNL